MNRDASFIYPDEIKHRKLGSLFNFFLPPLSLAIWPLLGWRTIPLLLVFLVSSVARVPETIYYTLLKNNYYNDIEKELPYFVLHMLVASSSSLSIEEAFKKIASINFFKLMKREALKLTALTRTGRSLEEALEILAGQSLSRDYSRFLRGLVTVMSTSNEVPKYAYDFLKDTLRSLEEKWKGYWSGVSNIVEISMLIGVAVITLTFVSAVMAQSMVSFLSKIMAAVALITGFVLYVSASAMKPLVEYGIEMKTGVWGFVMLVLLPALIMVFEKIGLEAHHIIIALASAMILSSIPIVTKKHRIREREKEILEKFKELVELERIGYSVSTAVEKIGYKDALEAYLDAGGRGFRIMFIDSMINLVWELGGGARQLFDTINYFVGELLWFEKSGRMNSLFSTVLSVILPSIMYYFSKSTLIRIGTPLHNVSSIDSVLLPFSAIAFSTNLIIGLLYDNTVSLWRAGISLLLLGLAGIISPL